jgi:hypothetical protein
MSLHLQLEMLVYIWILIAWLTELPLLLEIGKRKQSMLQHWSLRLELRGCPADTKTIHYLVVQLLEFKSKNHGTQDSHVVPHHGTNWAIPDLVAQIGRDATFYGFYGRGWKQAFLMLYKGSPGWSVSSSQVTSPNPHSPWTTCRLSLLTTQDAP